MTVDTTSASRLSPPRAPRATKVADETLKASDRRFFLQHSPERISPEIDGSTEGGKAASDAVEASSGGSSQIQMKGSAESDRPIIMKTAVRKGKEAVRPVGGRPTARRGQSMKPVIKRQVSTDGSKTHRPTFNIGSASSKSNTSNGVPNIAGPSNAAPSPPIPAPAPPIVKQAIVKQPAPKQASSKQGPNAVKTTAGAQGRRIVVASSASSDYETTDTEDDDDSWCSEEPSGAEDSKETKEETKLKEAALEAQRQRDMFAKVPKRSYSNLDRSRSGLLTALLNPDPNIFPPNHPYRNSFSSQDVTQLPRRGGALSGFTPMTSLSTSKSAAALPQASQAVARAPSGGGIAEARPNGKVDGGYQPKGRPQGQEMEEDTDTEEDNPDDKIQVSRSIAQERLAALAGRRSTKTSRPPQPPPTRPSLPTVTSNPIPFGHPYNLPAPAPPSTPRTTRRQMLSTELSESLRRNLLWERQVSKTTGQRRKSATVLGGGLRPLTSTTTGAESSRNPRPQPSTSHKSDEEGDEKAERKRRAMARNRSWADDYHYSGW